MAHPHNAGKNRKSDAQKAFENADNAGRFALNDNESRVAKEEAIEKIRHDTNSNSSEPDQQHQYTDTEAGRDSFQSYNNLGETWNVNDDSERPLNDEEIRNARNKANEGRDDNDFS